MPRQKVVDILGVLIPCGILALALSADAFRPNGDAGTLLCLASLLAVLSMVRVLLFRGIPKEERRQYDMRLWNAPGLWGRDFLIHPYTQAGLVLLFLIGTIAAMAHP